MTFADYLMLLASFTVLVDAVRLLTPWKGLGWLKMTRSTATALRVYTVLYFALAAVWGGFAHVSWAVPTLCSAAAALTVLDLVQEQRRRINAPMC